MSEWTRLGAVVLCQIHTDRMVHGDEYRDKLLAEVDALWLSPDGVVGQIGEQSVLHAHHRLHPTRTTGTTEKHRAYLAHRLLSFGFVGHYAAMAEHFGEAKVGCAAEDIIVDYDGVITLDQVSSGVQIRRGDRVLQLVGAQVAKPCVPFTKHLLKDMATSDEKVAPHVSFLGDGMRGFIVGLANATDPVDIQVGDEFWIKA